MILRWFNTVSGAAVLVASAAGVLAGPDYVVESGYEVDSYSYYAEAEKARREWQVIEADQAYWTGREYEAQGNLEQAVSQYRHALEILPVSSMTENRRKSYGYALAEVCADLARARMAEGRYEQARRFVEMGLQAYPEHRDLRYGIRLPEHTPPFQLDLLERDRGLRAIERALDYANLDDDRRHRENVEKVQQNLVDAAGNHSIGRYDAADENLYEVLRTDPYNTAARQQMEEVENSRMKYYETGYDQTRARALADIASKWETTVPPKGLTLQRADDGELGPGQGVDYISSLLRTITLDSIDLVSVTINEAVEFLRQRSQALDPNGRGISFVVDEQSVVAAGGHTQPISLSLRGVPLLTALQYVTQLSGLQYRIEAFAVRIVGSSDSDDTLYRKVYKVPASFETLSAAEGGAGAASDDPFGAPAGESGLAPRASASDILKARGITGPDGASAFFDATSSQLVVRNSQKNIELIDAFVESIQVDVPMQVDIQVKFVEIRQDNTEELGFDWLLGQYGGGYRGGSITSAGGTYGNSQLGLPDESSGNPIGYNFYPFNSFDESTGAPTPIGGNPITAGNRSGTVGIQGNAIDALLLEQNRGLIAGTRPSPGVLSVAGVLTDPQFQVVVRALSLKKGSDLMTAPNIVAKSGSRAKVEIIRELIYPTEYDPPELPQTVGAEATQGGFPVTPATPTAFTTRNTGVTLEVDPVVGPDGYTIDLNMAPEVVEFEGFVNYGSPITTAGINALNQPIQITITDNRIDMPVFQTRRATTNVTVWDGQTVAIGGLIREDVQHVEDKVPLVGDIPLLGRLFRSESEQHLKRNLMVFVTAKLINPAGERLRQPGTADGLTAVDDGLDGGVGAEPNLLLPPPDDF
ncbi:MAG TPA: Amuc_1098 family type IV pilus outer membrane protein [Verrucomicrobiales bacterium]|nr:Amuc_1098 family type IV pilus outer membrane protein [Verrucomicrobiales bacterium]